MTITNKYPVKLVLILSFFALIFSSIVSPQKAHASSSEYFSGSGSNSTSIFTLDSGIYEINASYSGNYDAYGADYMGITLESASDDIWVLIVNDFLADGNAKAFVSVTDYDIFWFDIDSSTYSNWNLSINKVSPPITKSNEIFTSGIGRTADGLFALEPGVYEFRTQIFGNYLQKNFWVTLERNTGGLDFLADTDDIEGTYITKVSVPEAAAHWIAVKSPQGVSWSVVGTNLTPPQKNFSSSAAPTISGIKSVGSKLTAKTGSWSPKPDKFTYQWLRNGQTISGATKATYTLSSADLNSTISVRITAYKQGYNDVTLTSNQTNYISKGTLSNSKKPKISGTAQVGKKLKATKGTWKPGSVKTTYTWYSNGKKISGATKSTYTLKTRDLGKKITVKVTAKKSGYKNKTITSSATKKIAKGTLSNSKKPKISGTAQVGKKLKATKGTWKPGSVKTTYTWYSNGKKISGATKSTYTLKTSDLGKKITVKVTAKKSGYKNKSVKSKATKTVK